MHRARPQRRAPLFGSLMAQGARQTQARTAVAPATTAASGVPSEFARHLLPDLRSSNRGCEGRRPSAQIRRPPPPPAPGRHGPVQNPIDGAPAAAWTNPARRPFTSNREDRGAVGRKHAQSQTPAGGPQGVGVGAFMGRRRAMDEPDTRAVESVVLPPSGRALDPRFSEPGRNSGFSYRLGPRP